MLKFANNDRSKLCCASLDGTLSVCEVIGTPPKVIAFLEGHRNGVTALDWSISNDLIVSSSLDATIRLWRVCADAKPVCLRVVDDQQRAEVLCCNFIPANNNLIIAGNSQGLIQILNVSTGIYTRGGSCKIGGKVSFFYLENKDHIQKASTVTLLRNVFRFFPWRAKAAVVQ